MFGQPSFPHASFAGFLEKEKPPAGPDVGSRFDSVLALSRNIHFITAFHNSKVDFLGRR